MSKQEYLSTRFKAKNRVPFILDALEAKRWDFTALCRMFVETVGYVSCWIALAFETGELKKLSLYKKDDIIPVPERALNAAISDFMKEALVHSSDYILNRDPLLEYFQNPVSEGSPPIHSITCKLSYNNIIYGIISILMYGDYESLREEVLILSDAVQTISFFLYDIDVRDKIKDIFITMFETTGNSTAIFEEDTIISYVNNEFEKLSGYSKEEIEGKMSWTEFVVPEDRERMLEYHRMRRVDPQEAPRNYEFNFIDRHGVIKNIYMTIDMVPRTKVSIASFMNITEKKRLESEVIRASEQERQQIGTDLHDGLSPHLVGIKLILKVLMQKVRSRVVPEIGELNEIDSLISDAIDQTRTLIKGLKPVDIQPDGLIYALEELVNKTAQRYKLMCSFDCDSHISIGDTITATHLYYIVQEAINNTIKHANARSLKVVMRKINRGLSIEISDDGIGIPQMLDASIGMGLQIMKYRASIISGDLTIEKLPHGGTMVLCTVTT